MIHFDFFHLLPLCNFDQVHYLFFFSHEFPWLFSRQNTNITIYINKKKLSSKYENQKYMLCLVAELESFKCRKWIASFLITVLKCVQLLSQLNRYEYFTYIKHCLQCAWVVIPEISCKKGPKLFIELLKCLVSLTITRY